MTGHPRAAAASQTAVLPVPADSSRARCGAVLVGLATILLLSMTLAVMIGPVVIPPDRVWAIALHHVAPGLVRADWPAFQDDIVWQIRFPRSLLGAVVGAGLAVVGVVMQAIVRNPLADPYLLGVSSGASVGAVAVILLGVTAFGVYSLSAAAFTGALGAFIMVFLLARQGGRMSPERLVLAGVAVSAMLSAVTSLLIFTADHDDQIRSVLFWMLGGLGGARWAYLQLPAAVLILGTGLLTLQSRSLNSLLLGDETASTLGVDTERFRRGAFAISSLLTGVMVSVSGGIGFIGLMAPHFVRRLVGADHRRVLPAAALLGAILLVWADMLARTVAAPEELPLGIVTALVGAPFFLALMWRHDAGGTRW